MNVRRAGLVLLAMIGVAAAGCGEPDGRVETPTTHAASASPVLTPGPPSPTQDDGTPADAGYWGDFNVPSPEFAPAAPDEYGTWSRVTMQGIAADIPTGPRWRIQIQTDPCYGDARYRYLLEDAATGDRIKVDVVDHRVTVASTDPARLDGVVSRIRGSFRGEQTPYPFTPTEPSCESETGGVPTLVPDTFSPGSPTSAPSATAR
jgi:hypothetical protein